MIYSIERIESGQAWADRSSAQFGGYVAADAMERSQAQTNAVCAAIRNCDLGGAQLRQILSTLACRMLACGYSDSDVELLETGAEVLA